MRSKYINYEGKRRYQVFEDGTIISFFQGYNWKKPYARKLKGSVSKAGYVTTRYKGKQEYWHRIIATAFIKKIKNKNCVNHKDGNKQNNHVNNLEWVNYSENHLHAFKFLGRVGLKGKNFGGGVHFDKLRQKWMVYHNFHGDRTYLGRYNSELKARKVLNLYLSSTYDLDTQKNVFTLKEKKRAYKVHKFYTG